MVRVMKDIAAAGTWRLSSNIGHLVISPERIDHWVQTFNRMKAAGVRVDLTRGHEPGARNKLGEVNRLFRDGDKLMAEFQFVDRGAASELSRRPYASVFINPMIRDGNGHRYLDAIESVGLTNSPAVDRQDEAVMLSRGVPSLSDTAYWRGVYASRQSADPTAPDAWVAEELSRANGPDPAVQQAMLDAYPW